jgi:uncharacterized membrane protein YdfJ with MMPL/SSD domain
MKKLIYLFICVILVACNNAKDDSKISVSDREYTADSMSGGDQRFRQEDNKPFTGTDKSKEEEEKEESRRIRELIYMSIDSTYFAIHAIEDVKNEISSESSVQLSVAERNLKSRALMKLNIIQNSLARQVDSTLLINLKNHTRELAGINSDIASNVARLKDISARLDKVTSIMSRLTNVLTFCLSKGLVKPPTPVNGSPGQVKATVQ